jgi:beta-xylosidase
MLRKRGEVRGEKKILTVAGVYSTTTQQERNNNEAVAGAALRQSHNNEANDVTKRRQNLRIFGISRKRGEFTATLWLERRFNNDTGVRNRRKKPS